MPVTPDVQDLTHLTYAELSEEQDEKTFQILCTQEKFLAGLHIFSPLFFILIKKDEGTTQTYK